MIYLKFHLNLPGANQLICLPWDLPNDRSTLVQVLAWCFNNMSESANICLPDGTKPLVDTVALPLIGWVHISNDRWLLSTICQHWEGVYI